MKTATARPSRKATVRKVTSATAQIQHVATRIGEIARAHARSKCVNCRDNPQLKRVQNNITALYKEELRIERGIDAINSRIENKVAALRDRTIDTFIMSGAPINLPQVLRDFKTKLAAIR